MAQFHVSLAIEIAAVLSGAASGMLTASEKRMDLVGTYALAFCTAFGGGTVRDVLLDRRPFFWVSQWQYLVIILLLCVIFSYSRGFHATVQRLQQSATVADALGLGLFSLTGVVYALSAGLPIFVASLVGVVTGSFGGVLRDLVINEIPELFRPGGLYATSAFLGCWVLLGGIALGFDSTIAALLGFVTIVGLRLGSVRYGFTLPVPHWMRRG